MADPRQALQPGDALVLVDVQRDFCPGGALPVERGDEVVPTLNRWLSAAAGRGVPVFASRDWHPERHMSFAESGGRWPAHCVQDTAGAAFHPDLALPPSTVVVTKGDQPDRDQYSAFDGTGLAQTLRERGVKRVWVGGLAQDVCVRATVLDALREGFETVLITDAARALSPESGERATEEMRAAGARLESTG